MDAVRITDGVYWVGAVGNQLRARGLELLGPSLEVQYIPDEEDLAKCVEFGRVAAERLREGLP